MMSIKERKLICRLTTEEKSFFGGFKVTMAYFLMVSILRFPKDNQYNLMEFEDPT